MFFLEIFLVIAVLNPAVAAEKKEPGKNKQPESSLYHQLKKLVNLQYFERYGTAKLGEIALMIYREGAHDSIILAKEVGNEILLQDSPDNLIFIKADYMQITNKDTPVLVSTWNKGMHSVELRIYDLSKKAQHLAYSTIANMNLTYEIKNKKIEIKKELGLDNNGEPKYEQSVWPAN